METNAKGGEGWNAKRVNAASNVAVIGITEEGTRQQLVGVHVVLAVAQVEL